MSRIPWYRDSSSAEKPPDTPSSPSSREVVGEGYTRWTHSSYDDIKPSSTSNSTSSSAQTEEASNPFATSSAEDTLAAVAGAAGAAHKTVSSSGDDTEFYGGEAVEYDSDDSTRELPFEPRIYYSFDQFPQMRPLHEAFADIQGELKQLEVNVLDIFRSRDRWTETIGGSFFEECSKQYGWIHSWQVESEEQNANWLNFGLIHQDVPLKENSKRCPKTMAVFQKIIEKYGNAENGQPVIRVAGFSLMRPNSHIPPHTDTTGLRYNCMAYHLGLVVPDPDKCLLTVNGIDAREENGKSLIFDATYTHKAVNKCNSDRIILYVDFSIDTGRGLTF